MDEDIFNIKARLAKKLNIKFYGLRLFCNAYPINEELTVSQFGEYGITKESIIHIMDLSNIKGAGPENNDVNNKTEEKEENEEEDKNIKYSICFTDTYGRKIIIYSPSYVPIGIVIFFYLLKRRKFQDLMDLINNRNEIIFIYAGFVIKINDRRRVEEIFGKNITNSISVSDIHPLICG